MWLVSLDCYLLVYCCSGFEKLDRCCKMMEHSLTDLIDVGLQESCAILQPFHRRCFRALFSLQQLQL